VKTIIAQKLEKREQKQQNKTKKEEEEEEENRQQKDLLDFMIDSTNEEGAVLTRAELADQTKTYVMEMRESERERDREGERGREEREGERVRETVRVGEVIYLIIYSCRFLLAGYETSSVCILWTMHLLSKHPDIQTKLANEIISVIGKDRLPTGMFFIYYILGLLFFIIF
jgi:Cytochrome P450